MESALCIILCSAVFFVLLSTDTCVFLATSNFDNQSFYKESNVYLIVFLHSQSLTFSPVFGAWNTLVSGKASNLNAFLMSLIFTTARLHKS